MSNPIPSSSYYGSNDVIALQQLKDASLWFIIITLLGYIGLFVNVGAIVSIVSLILLFIVGIPKLRTAFQSFAITGKDVNSGFTGLKILPFGILISFIGGLLAIVGAVASIFSASSLALAAIGGVLAILGAIVTFIGYLLIGITIFNLGGAYSSDMMKIGGILIIIPGISFVGWILTYISIDDIVRRLTYGPSSGYPPSTYPPTGTSQYPPYNPQPAYGSQPVPNIFPASTDVYQIGIGQINQNGEAKVTLMANRYGLSITSASIENSTIYTTQVYPSTLNQGQNEVTIRFPQLINLVPGNIYNVLLYLSNGQMVRTVVKFNPGF
ncbi:DUF973 family protein [Stygiolobus sp. CP850M]|uniref:DUF973 family protein n=1 Tax=Stygiolobus sp. CP850M TaxID=3133134 RepID=UPI00307EBAF3